MSRGTILIVEDNHPVRKWLAGALGQEGYTTLEASSAHDASALARYADIIILDLELPEITGEEFVRGLRRKGHLIPVVVHTAWEDRARALSQDPAAGIAATIIKPATPYVISERVATAMAAARKINYVEAASTCVRKFVEKRSKDLGTGQHSLGAT